MSGIGRRFTRWYAIGAAIALIAVVIPLALPAIAEHEDFNIEVKPEPNTSGNAGAQPATVGTNHTITVFLVNTSSDATTAGIPINVDFELMVGVHNQDSDSKNTPDLTCTIPVGQTTCQVSYPGTNTGNDDWAAWIDHGNNNSISGGEIDEGFTGEDGEGRDSGDHDGESTTVTSANNPGAGCDIFRPGEEPDCYDEFRVAWGGGPAATLDCDDATGPDTERESNPSQSGAESNEVYGCTAKDQFGNNAGGVVKAEIENNINDTDFVEGASYDREEYNCTLSSGQCTITIEQADMETGTAEICFWIGDAAAGQSLCSDEPTAENQAPDLSDTGNDLADQAEKTWETRSTAAGGIDAEPESDQNDLGQDHAVTVTVYDQFGAPFNGNTTVNMEFYNGSPSDADGNTPQSPDKTCTTANTSTCTITYTEETTPGRDLACLWINSAPAMSGGNQTGTCDNEPLNDADDAAGEPDPPQPSNDDVDVIEKVWRSAEEASRLDCTPETASNPTGNAHTITCTARSTQTTVAGAVIDIEASGANDPDGSSSTATPDFTCTTGNDGSCSVTHGPSGTSAQGTTTYRAWIDSDNSNSTVEADNSEGRDEASAAGADPEPDDTDVVEKSWTGGPANLSISPESDSATVGACNPYTITVTDSGAQGVAGVTIDVEQRHALANNQTPSDEPTVSFCTPTEGPNPSGVDETDGDLRPPDENPDNPGTAGGETTTGTNSSGQVTIGIQVSPGNGSDGTGQVSLAAFLDSADNDDPDQNEAQDTATKDWTQGATQCSDGQDNDGDGEVDDADAGCESPSDDDESDEIDDRCNDPGVECGTNGDDVIIGTDGDDVIICGAGDDTVDGRGGDDQIECNGGDDQIKGGDGNDNIKGGGGNDSCEGEDGNDIVNCGAGNDIIRGGADDDVLRSRSGGDSIRGGGGDDSIRGGGGKDAVRGGGGNDIVRGQGGNDVVTGGGGNDSLKGNAGRDTLRGGSGNDILNGGKGRDRCAGGNGTDRLRSCE